MINTRFPLPTLLCVEYSVKLKNNFGCFRTLLHFCVSVFYVLFRTFSLINHQLTLITVSLTHRFRSSLPFRHNSLITLFYLHQLQALSRIQQGRQRKPSVETLRSPLSTEFWRRCVLIVGSQRRIFALMPERRNENINKQSFISVFPHGDVQPTTVTLQ